MNLIDNINNVVKNKMLLSENETAKVLGIPKKDVQELIGAGTLPSISLSDKRYVSVCELSKMLGESTINSGQFASGQIDTEELYCSHQNQIVESEDDGMEYKGNISTLKDGRFMVQINLGKKPDGSRNRESKGFRSKSEADAYLKRRLNELNRVSTGYNLIQPTMVQSYAPVQNLTDMTFEEYTKMVLNNGVGTASRRTIEGYRVAVLPVIKRIGQFRMVDIEIVQLRKIFEELSFIYLSGPLRKAYRTTRMIFQIAFENDDIAVNPFFKLKMPKSRKGIKKEIKPYTSDELQTILHKAKEHHNPMLYPLLIVLECTGMRPGELRGLEWKNFSADTKTIKITNAVNRTFAEISDLSTRPKSCELLGMTKSATGIRTLSLSGAAVEALLEWRKELDKMTPERRNSKFIFPSHRGDFVSEDAVKGILQRFIKKNNLQDMGITLYRFRHTLCTRLSLTGMPVSVIQEIMGDSTQDVVLGIYTHVTNEQALKAHSGYCENSSLSNTF